MEQHKLVVFSVRWPKKDEAALCGYYFPRGELDLCPKLDITFAQAFPSPSHTHTHAHRHSHMCLVYFYVKRIKKSFLEFRRHKLIFIYDPRISKSRWNGSTFLWDRQTDRYMAPSPLCHTSSPPACLVAKCITPLNYYSSLVNSFSDAAGEDLCCLVLRSSLCFSCIFWGHATHLWGLSGWGRRRISFDIWQLCAISLPSHFLLSLVISIWMALKGIQTWHLWWSI